MEKSFLLLSFTCLSLFSFSQSTLDVWYGNYYGGLDSFVYDSSSNDLILIMPEVEEPENEFRYLNLDKEDLTFDDYVITSGNSFTIENYVKGNYHNYTFDQRYFIAGDPSTVIFAGIELNHVEQKGAVLIIMDEDLHPVLESTFEEYKLSLIGDGWSVKLLLVAETDKDFEVKQKIKEVYTQTENLRSLFIIGKVAIPLSGIVPGPDGHGYHTGAWIADGYYADMDFEWTDESAVDTANTYPIHDNRIGDGRYDHTELPSAAELEVGRIYFENLPIFEEAPHELYRRYLAKNIKFRRHDLTFNNDFFLHWNSAAFPDKMHRNLFLLSENAQKDKRITQTENLQPDVALTEDSYLYGSINGFGAPGGQSINGRITSTNFKNDSIQLGFASLAASNIGNWSYNNNLMNTSLASKSPTLGVTWGVFNMPTQYLQAGETFGYCHRKGANNDPGIDGDYQSFSFNQPFEVAHTYWGDPTLTLRIVEPINNLDLLAYEDSISIEWGQPSENILGVNIYRSDSIDGNFVQLNDNMLTEGIFTDIDPINGENYYMLRSVRLDSSASCSFYNYGNGVIEMISINLPDRDGDGFATDEDCDDADPNINPDAEEIANNGIDENCDGMDFVTALHELANSTIEIYPNPASDFINIIVDTNINFQSRLFSMNGKLIQSSTNNNLLNINSIPSGMYLLEIEDLKSGEKIVERILIEN